MSSKQWLHPAPTYRTFETYWDNDEDAPGPRCGHTLTAVGATKSHGPRLILFGGATAIEGGSSSAPGIRTDSSLRLCLWFVSFLVSSHLKNASLLSVGLAGVTNSVYSYGILTRKWTR